MKQFLFQKIGFEDVIFANLFCVSDDRGSLMKIFAAEEFAENNISLTAAEETLLCSKKGVLRGLHFQKIQPQDKLISCIDGKLWTVVVNINAQSDSFGKWRSCELTAGTALYVPGHYAVGTLALEDSFFHIAFGAAFDPSYSSGIRWDDKTLNIAWPELPEIKIAEKDRALQSFSEYAKQYTNDEDGIRS